MAHNCDRLKMLNLKDDGFGNHLIFSHGKRFTDGHDVNFSINVDGMNDLFAERWKTQNGGITCDRESVPIWFCPFCGEMIRKETYTFDELDSTYLAPDDLGGYV